MTTYLFVILTMILVASFGFGAAAVVRNRSKDNWLEKIEEERSEKLKSLR